MTHKNPPHPMPYLLWLESVDYDPTLEQCRERFDAVSEALEAFRVAGWWQPVWLLEEVGIVYRRMKK